MHALPDDCDATAQRPGRGLYAGFAAAHRCDDAQVLDVTWAQVGADLQRARARVVCRALRGVPAARLRQPAVA